ncbi:MFS transporter [Streptococcus sp. S784/96/1]|uniref:MFS transporter n=1 Tax=Streptococcus sp. S784/96/1 TaxID=2653499 RepID=UPI001386B697|nr:MFS transporter [Streptococcus sp. S784/96/1]
MFKKKVKDSVAAANKVGFWRLMAWKSRDISLGGLVIVLGYLTIYATDTLKMPATLVGTLLMASKIFDAFTDLIAGYVIDNTNTRFGKARPYEICIFFAWLATIGLFSIPAEFSLVAKSIWMFVMYTLVNSVFQTLLYAAQQPYTIRAWGSRERIIKVASYGGIISTFGSVAVSVSFPIFMRKLSVATTGWTRLVTTYAVALAFIGILRFVFVKEDAVPAGQTPKLDMKQIFTMLRKNPYVWLVGIICGGNQFIIGMHTASYYFTWIVGDIGQYGKLQMFTIPMLLVMFIFPKLMRKMSTPQLIIIFTALGVAGFILNFFAGKSMAMLIIAFLATGLAQLPAAYLQAPLIMEVSTYNEYIGLPRMDSSSASIMNFMMKTLNGLGAGILGVFLGMAGYDGAAKAQSDSAIMMIRYLYSFIPAIVLILAIVAAIRFNKLSKAIPEMEAEIAARAK